MLAQVVIEEAIDERKEWACRLLLDRMWPVRRDINIHSSTITREQAEGVREAIITRLNRLRDAHEKEIAALPEGPREIQ